MTWIRMGPVDRVGETLQDGALVRGVQCLEGLGSRLALALGGLGWAWWLVRVLLSWVFSCELMEV